jgi:prophage maintenance system killer protein
MGITFASMLKEKWNKEVGRRWDMLSMPDSFIDKRIICSFQKEILHRSFLPFNSIEELSQPIPVEWVDACAIDMRESLYYGALPVLLDYAGLSGLTMPPMNLGVQHGYVFEICNWEKSKLEKRNLVWSRKLVEMYREYTDNPDIYAIGAAYFYARPLLDDHQFTKERKRLGKNLLAFPMHSQGNVDTNYDPQKFLNILEEERKRFDTVRVCMYWKDILRGAHKVYLDAGYECVCNGHIYDLNFLRRQKTLFELADATISNGVGSHIGYSLYSGKPHWLIDDEYEYVNTHKTGDAKDMTDVTLKDNFLSVKNAFLNNPDYLITQQQKDVVDVFWGLSDMKRSEDLRELLLSLYKL